MFLRIDARGPGSDEISYQIGNHPGRQLIRRESEVLGRLWFPEYQEEQVSVVLHVRSNIPPIPGRLTSSSIRYREWDRFAEWINEFMGKVISDPSPVSSGESTPEFRVTLGILPEQLEFEETLVDLFERADLNIKEPTGGKSRIERWLRVKTSELSFSQLLRRLSILIPPLFGRESAGFHARGYAKLLDRRRGTWFNMHPLKSFLVNRFLCLDESAPEPNRENEAVSIDRERERFQSKSKFYRDVGEEVCELVKSKKNSPESAFWMINARDGFLLPSLDDLIGDSSFHVLEGRRNALNRCEQRVNFLMQEGEIPSGADPQFHWCPSGFRRPELHGAKRILWLPRMNELKDGLPLSIANVFLSGYQPDRLLIWTQVREGRILPPSGVGDTSVPPDAPNRKEWISGWEDRAEDEQYNVKWRDVEPTAPFVGAPDTSLLGLVYS